LSEGLGFGLADWLQLVPSNFSISGKKPALSYVPTAQTLPEGSAAAPDSKLKVGFGLGVVRSRVHVAPFQCSANVLI
jgi:hypothetical protein